MSIEVAFKNMIQEVFEESIDRVFKKRHEEQDKDKTQLSDQYLSIKQSAHYLNISPRTLRTYIIKGLLPAHQLGFRITRIKKSDLDLLLKQKEYMNAHKVTAEISEELIKKFF